MLEIISPTAAKAAGLKWYFTGLPCSHGHLAKRSITNGECRGCVDARAARQRKENPARLRQKDKRKYWRDPEKRRRLLKESRLRHIEVRREEGRAKYRLNPAAALARKRAWDKAHPEYLRHQSARRRAAIANAMPRWLSGAQRAAIRAIYAAAPAGHEVDHVIPLRGKTVCGLHVPWNLQIIPMLENRTKGNRFDQNA